MSYVLGLAAVLVIAYLIIVLDKKINE
jgi:hypothetical protein